MKLIHHHGGHFLDLGRPGEQHHQDQHNGVDDHAVIRQTAHGLRQDVQRRGGDDGAEDIAHAAQHHEDQNVDGGVEVELRRIQGGVVQAVQRARHARQERGDHEGLHAEGGDVDAHGLGGNPVVPDGLDGPAFLGIDQVQHHKQGEQDQAEAGGKGGQLLHTGDAHGAAEDPLALAHQLGLCGGDGKAEAGFIGADIHIADDILHDLAEGQGHDGQIVAPQPQDGNADEEADDGSQQTADENGNNHQQNGVTDVLVQKGNGHNAGKRADAHKTGMAQAQLAADAHQKVQGNRQGDVDTDGNQVTIDRAAQHSGSVQKLHDNKRRNDHKIGDSVGPGGFVFQHIFHSHHLTPSPGPACPAGQRASPAE